MARNGQDSEDRDAFHKVAGVREAIDARRIADDADMAALVDRMRVGDEGAVAELMAATLYEIDRTAGKYVGKGMERGELVSAAYTLILERLPSFDPERGCRFRTWVINHAKYAMANATNPTRKLTLERWLRDNQDQTDALRDSLGLPDGEAIELDDPLVGLGPTLERAVRRGVITSGEALQILRRAEGATSREVAAELGIKPTAEAKRFQRAKDALRALVTAEATES